MCCFLYFIVRELLQELLVNEFVRNRQFIDYDQIIREFDSWTHISIPNEVGGTPRKQALVIDKTGTRIYS